MRAASAEDRVRPAVRAGTFDQHGVCIPDGARRGAGRWRWVGLVALTDWIDGSGRHRFTTVCERALRAAAGIQWQHMGAIAAGQAAAFGQDYYDPARAIIAEYLRHTGREEEACEVQAIGCNEPAPRTGFAPLTEAERSALRAAMRGG